MPTEAQIDAAAAAAAEKANGGRFSDPLFYKPEHQAFWRDVVLAALNAAEIRLPLPEPEKATSEEVEIFSSHCVHIRSVYTLMMRIWRDSNETERKVMELLAPNFFENVGQVLAEFIVNAACRITEPAVTRNNENLTLEVFVKSFPADSDTHRQLNELLQQMKAHRKRILPARHKLGAHADRDVIREGKALGAASWEEWKSFWTALEAFVRILNEKTTGHPFEIEAAGVLGDAEMLIKGLQNHKHFETLLNSTEPAVSKACQDLALQKT